MGSDVSHMPLLQWRWSVVLIMVLGASATFDDERLRGGKGGNFFKASAGFEETAIKASKSTDKKSDWITQTGCTDKEKVCTDGKLAAKVAGSGEILVVKTKTLAWTSSKPERKAMMGKTSDNKPFWAASFVGSLQIAIGSNLRKGAAIRLGFVKMSICKMRSSSNGCEDSTELEDAAATQEFEKVQQRLKNRRGSRRLLDSQAKKKAGKKAAGAKKEAKKVVAGAKKEAADTKNVEGGSESKVPSNVKSMAAAEKKAAKLENAMAESGAQLVVDTKQKQKAKQHAKSQLARSKQNTAKAKAELKTVAKAGAKSKKLTKQAAKLKKSNPEKAKSILKKVKQLRKEVNKSKKRIKKDVKKEGREEGREEGQEC